jgi:hypothetical protein
MTDIIDGATIDELQQLRAQRRIRLRDIPEHQAWYDAKRRCLNASDTNYLDYGGRGITFHEPWIEDFWAFFRHVGRRPERRIYLDRIDNDGGYVPGNLRWADATTSNLNRRPELAWCEGHPQAKLTWEKVKEIRSLAGTSPQRDIAKEYGVSQPLVHLIIRNRVWHDPEYVQAELIEALQPRHNTIGKDGVRRL